MRLTCHGHPRGGWRRSKIERPPCQQWSSSSPHTCLHSVPTYGVRRASLLEIPNGLMAFEATHQLHRCGITAGMVILLDSKAQYPAPHNVVWEKLKRDWKRKANSWSKNGSPQSIENPSLFVVLEWIFVKELKLLWRRFKQAALGDFGVLTTSVMIRVGRCIGLWLSEFTRMQ